MEFSVQEILTNNYVCALVCFLSVLNCVYICNSCFTRRKHQYAFWWLAVLSFTFALWDFSRGMYYILNDELVAKYFYRVVHVGVALSGPSYFLFAFMYSFTYKIKTPKKKNTWCYALYIVPLITSIILLVPAWGNFFETIDDGFIYMPLREVVTHHAPYFLLHTVYNYGLVVAGAVLLFIRVIKPQTRNKISCTVACIASLIFIGWNCYTTFFSTQTIFTRCVTVFTHSFVAILFFMTMYYDEDESLVFSGQEGMISLLPFPVFIVNDLNRVLYSNFQASLFLSPEMKAKEVVLFDDVMSQFKVSKIQIPAESGGGYTTQLQYGADTFFMYENVIQGKNTRAKGKLVMLVTQAEFSTLFKNLEAKAFHDAMSGCYNRHFLEVKKSDFDSEKMLPLSLVMCDVDGLKYVNDNFGHDVGDEYIKMCVDAIRTCIRTTDFVFRLGGDEFLVVLPHAPERGAHDVKRKIMVEMEMRGENLPYKASLSIGTAIINSTPIDFSLTMKTADERMYAEKKAKKINM